MKTQKGAALIVVLSLLTISLMVGLSSMQSSQIDERLAGNYKAASQAQMGAEEAASAGWESVKDASWEKLSDLTEFGLDSLSWKELKDGQSGLCELPVSCYYRYVDDGGDMYIVAMGAVDDGNVAVSEPVFVEVAGSGLKIPFLKNAYNVIDGYKKDNWSANDQAQEWSDLIVDTPNLFEEDVPATPSQFLSFVDSVKRAAESGKHDNIFYFDEDPGKISGNDGLVVINGDFKWAGKNNFKGLLIVLGESFEYKGAGQPGLMDGAVLHVPTSSGCRTSEGSECKFTIPKVNVSGGVGGFRYNEKVIDDLRDSLGGVEGALEIRSW
ncbi:MAG: pilus assembly PilX N-terminal domain-containing protein [Halomonas sp.]|uniref:pilus assembly PilX family protein n=1 Tax=Halomonas sp. TaxID=1486246 RepID=UPI002ACD4678|nr:pilus assembly PilX N-terminal domain-containing protein [Halomonas sp.]MDZ7854228.1 pilus assembly PilX N-terminal domain-containing protein [Halomonas sp.]